MRTGYNGFSLDTQGCFMPRFRLYHVRLELWSDVWVLLLLLFVYRHGLERLLTVPASGPKNVPEISIQQVDKMVIWRNLTLLSPQSPPGMIQLLIVQLYGWHPSARCMLWQLRWYSLAGKSFEISLVWTRLNRFNSCGHNTFCARGHFLLHTTWLDRFLHLTFTKKFDTAYQASLRS